jgi:putative transposase
MGNDRENLLSDKYYHIYNHSNGADNLFRTEENYSYFLKKYAQYFNVAADTYAYCLMPNHFHFLLRIKAKHDLIELFKNEDLEDVKNLSNLLAQQFGNFFNSYAKSINKQFDRKGSLFNGSFKRKEVNNKAYFRNLVHYIHYNPVHHNFVKSMEEWPYSSYNSILSSKSSSIKRNETIEWFDDVDSFKSFHKNKIDSRFILDLDF